jgi:hypothetical protein
VDFTEYNLGEDVSFQDYMEMARPLDQAFEPGYEIWAKRDDSGRIIPNKPKYLVGKSKGSSELQIFNITSGMRYQKPLTLKKGMSIGQVLSALKSQDYEKVEHKEIASGKAIYAGGKEHASGVVEQWKGTVYHGTNDIDFFGSTYNSGDLGHGSHLQSLNGGDAMSVTPNIEVAKEFAFDGEGVGMVIEFKADLKLYYASLDEDDLDEIDLPDGVDAVAIPYGQFQEDEFAVVQWDSPDTLSPVAVHLPIGKDLGRYEFSVDPAIYGNWKSWKEVLSSIFKAMKRNVKLRGE